MSTRLTTAEPAEGAPAESLGASSKPLVEVTAGPGGISRQALGDLWAFREVLLAFAVRFVKIKYKQAAIGVGWAVLQPVLSALIFALIFGRYAHLPSEGLPFMLFSLVGMVAWTFFSTAISTAAQSLVDDQGLIRKVYFPREVLPLGAILAALVDLAAGLLVLLIALLLYQKWPAVTWLMLPVPIALLVVTAVAGSLAFAALNVYYRDVRYVLPFMLQIGLFASAVIYPLSVFPAAIRDAWAIANPVVAAIEALRAVLARHEWPDFPVLFAACAWAVVLAVASYAVFKRLERAFSDRV